MKSSYFNKIPKVDYDILKNGQNMQITDIFRRVRILKGVLENDMITYEYYIKEFDTPESIAYKYYGSPYYHWVVMMTNDINDIHADWPLNYEQFNTYIVKTYGSEQEAHRSLHHYEDADGVIIHRDEYIELLSTEGAEPPVKVSMLDYETNLNDSKRTIKLLNKNFLYKFLEDFEEKLI